MKKYKNDLIAVSVLAGFILLFLIIHYFDTRTSERIVVKGYNVDNLSFLTCSGSSVMDTSYFFDLAKRDKRVWVDKETYHQYKKGDWFSNYPFGIRSEQPPPYIYKTVIDTIAP